MGSIMPCYSHSLMEHKILLVLLLLEEHATKTTLFFFSCLSLFARKITPWSPQIADIWIRQHETDEFSYLQTEIETTYKIFFKKQKVALWPVRTDSGYKQQVFGYLIVSYASCSILVLHFI